MSSAEWTPVIVGKAIRRLLESRRSHLYQGRMQAQLISSLESAIESRAIHDRGTARRLKKWFESWRPYRCVVTKEQAEIPRLGTKKKRTGKTG
jgi:hypothetical protein